MFKAPWGVSMLPALRDSEGRLAHRTPPRMEQEFINMEERGEGESGEQRDTFKKISKRVRKVWQVMVPLDLAMSEPRIGRRHTVEGLHSQKNVGYTLWGPSSLI